MFAALRVDHRAQPGARGAVAGARVLHRRRPLAAAAAEFLAIALVLVYVGAVMVLFLFVVMMLDVNFDNLRARFWSYLPVGATVGAAGAAGDGAGAARRAAIGAARAAGRRCSRQQHQGARHAALHRLRLPVRDRRGDPAGGDHRRDRADAAPAQGNAVPEPVRAGEGAPRGSRAADQDAGRKNRMADSRRRDGGRSRACGDDNKRRDTWHS